MLDISPVFCLWMLSSDENRLGATESLITTRQDSSMAERRFCKPGVASSNLALGFFMINALTKR